MLFPGAYAWQAAIHHWGLRSSVRSSECRFRSPWHSRHTQPTFSCSCHYCLKWFCSLMFPRCCLSCLQTVDSMKAGQCLSGSPLCPWCLEQSREQESFLKCLPGGCGTIMWSKQKGQGRKKNNKSTENSLFSPLSNFTYICTVLSKPFTIKYNNFYLQILTTLDFFF